jgi:5'-nucleotidase
MRLMVTNDDGIDSVGLYVLAEAMQEFGEVVVAAPDREYSGAGAAIGALWLTRPEVHRLKIDGFENAWSVSGPPALCVMFARLGAFGPRPDIVVSGINPGANVGRSVYHSGTIGAALTARNGGINGVAVSQSVTGFGAEGQGWDDAIANQRWETAATIAAEAVAAMIASPPAEPSVLNINVPNLPLEEIKGRRWTTVGNEPPRAMATAVLEPKIGHEGTFYVDMAFGEERPQNTDTDVGTIMADEVSLTWLGRLAAVPNETGPIDARLDSLLRH